MQEKVSEATIRLLDIAARLEQALDKEMKAAGLPAFIWFRIMRELSEEGQAGLRPFELQRRVHLAQYNLSRIVERMEHAGLLVRFPALDDQRGHVLKLSARGAEQVEALENVYQTALGRHLGDRLNSRKAAQLLNVLAEF